MRLHAMLSSSAVLAALCSMMVVGGCGGDSQATDEGSNPTLQDGELGSAPGTDDEDSGKGKITICHVPPGNPANAHTIVVGEPAWKGHLKHPGDYLGPCGGQPDAGVPPTDGGTQDPGTGQPDAGTPPPACVPQDGACNAGSTCCDGLVCNGELGTCQPVIN